MTVGASLIAPVLVVGVRVPLVRTRVGQEVHQQGDRCASQNDQSSIGQQGCVDCHQAWIVKLGIDPTIYKPDVKLEKNSLGSDSDSSYSSKESSSSKAEAKPKNRRERAREEENMLDSLVSKTSSTSGLAGGTPGTVCGLQDEALRRVSGHLGQPCMQGSSAIHHPVQFSATLGVTCLARVETICK